MNLTKSNATLSYVAEVAATMYLLQSVLGCRLHCAEEAHSGCFVDMDG